MLGGRALKVDAAKTRNAHLYTKGQIRRETARLTPFDRQEISHELPQRTTKLLPGTLGPTSMTGALFPSTHARAGVSYHIIAPNCFEAPLLA